MAVEKAPYITYTEVTSYSENINNGSEIPVFIVKTDNEVTVADISPNNILRFISYNKFKQHFSISDEENVYNELPDSIKELDTVIKDFFYENSMYGENSDYGLSVPYIYMIDVGSDPRINHYLKALEVSETKKNSTVVVCPNTEDVKFMTEVNTKLKSETANGLLRIGYFGISGQGNLTNKFTIGNVLRPTFDHHGYVDVVKGYLKEEEDETKQFYENLIDGVYSNIITVDANYIYQDIVSGDYYKYENDAFVETTLDALAGYNEVVEVYKKREDGKFYTDSTLTTEVPSPSQTAIFLNKLSYSKIDAYTYTGTGYTKINVQFSKDELLYADDKDYKFFVPSSKKELGGNDESFDGYCERCEYISRVVNSSRVGIIEKEHLGKTIARICSTPYYLEPGYLPYMSISSGLFEERSKDERDSLFATGLIFNEDDYTLPTITPRICLATSTAWGIEDHDMRVSDALIHARRNVDHHIRRILKIIAPQLKRNETSVTLRHVQNQVDLYLDSELTKGTIMEYSVEIKESSFNPYALLVKGRIVPINSTLGIDFENTVGSPYTIATDYV